MLRLTSWASVGLSEKGTSAGSVSWSRLTRTGTGSPRASPVPFPLVGANRPPRRPAQILRGSSPLPGQILRGLLLFHLPLRGKFKTQDENPRGLSPPKIPVLGFLIR